jgi:hypothetical protein
MQLIFVHGWSVTSTDTYGELPEALERSAATYGLSLSIQHVWLGKYVSFHDEVTLDDIAIGLDRALRELPGNATTIQPFSCITHSTGGPVVRHWADRFYGDSRLAGLPLQHLIMLAPANHGSALAVLGKQRLGRIKAWFNGVEPGQRVLDWLSLGSKGQWRLNRNYLDYDYVAAGFYPFVLTGQGIDHKFYDFLNNYLTEPGSDGVVRVSGANMNYRFFSLQQTDTPIRPNSKILQLQAAPVQLPKPVPLGVYRDYSHSGDTMGIMFSIKANKGDSQPVVKDILKCLQVSDSAGYQQRFTELEQQTKTEQQKDLQKNKRGRYAMLVFHVHDEQDRHFEKDEFDLLLLTGANYQPGKMPDGFLKDRQMNISTHNLVFYVDCEKLQKIKDGRFGIRVVAQPAKGFAYYRPVEYRSDGTSICDVLVPNQTTYVDICLKRKVDVNVFRFDRGDAKRGSFKKVKPAEGV